jgi:anthraniloyl-CoA monooxygenase
MKKSKIQTEHSRSRKNKKVGRNKAEASKTKITTLGGGPAGLYVSMLLKKADPTLDITVIERNPPGATFGWGVVFSDRTLSGFREADHKSYVDITDQFVLWDAIDINYRGERLRCGGHTFAGMSRRELLLILQNRCREVGVKLKFEVEVTDPHQFTDSDLFIAADGINSITRQTFADAFQPSLDVRKAKFAWYGTHKVFDSFTFIFIENEHGLFQAHCYPFDGDTSTFIVECEESIWQRAGLDKLDEMESLAYCEELFADYLGGHGLLSNRSLWVNFVTVKNKKWYHKNIVLLGDAVHTAHFSIGSGTKLAMEAAIALANAFEKHGHNWHAVFKDYEAERRPRTDILQAAAQESLIYFENVKRYAHLDPLQFSFYLLARSGRISYNNLSQRDPHFTGAVTRWFAAMAASQQKEKSSTLLGGNIIAPPPMFAPLQLRDLTLANRVVLAPVSTASAEAGIPNSTDQNQLVIRATGGAAMVMTEPVAVSAGGRITPGDVGMYSPEHAAAWTKIVEAVHANSGAKIAVHLNHAGRRGSTRPRQEGLDRPLRHGNWPLLSASPLPYTSHSQTPRQMGRADMDKVRDEFGQAAQMAHKAGFDLLQLHCAHGYLLASFISPLTNTRQDDYGGSLENRLRFPLEVFEAVRAEWPQHKPMSVALSATDWAKDGLEVDEAVIIAKILKAQGCDLIEVLAGHISLNTRPVYGPYFLTPFSDQIRNEVGIATMTSGGITNADQINTILAAGRADLCIMNPSE